ncbi:MAG: hypothetical protein ACJAT1_000148 [Marivirga sp.]|jgi:hypothetical protein
MNPSERGWLEKYLQYRSSTPIQLDRQIILNEDKLLYKIVQPTGLLYGHPLHSPTLRHPKEQRWNSLGKMKVVLLESFLHSAVLKTQDKPTSIPEWEHFYIETGKSIGHFYATLNPEKHKKSFFSILEKTRDDFKYAEDALRKNLFLKSRWDYFWSSLFQNSLLFLDTYYFGEWKAGRFHNIKWHKDAIKIMVLKVLAAAAHANNLIKREERNMFFSFLSSANLTKGHEKLLKAAFRDGITLEQIDLRQADTWLLKKYVLELAVLMIWSDQKVALKERAFLLKLAALLGFSEIDLEVSLIAIESFVIENWKEVYFLQSKHSYQVIGETILTRLKFVADKNKEALVLAFQQSKEILQLLEKSKQNKLGEEEKENLRIQIIDILKRMPELVIIALPDTFLTLAVLLKIIPKELFPTSFLD